MSPWLRHSSREESASGRTQRTLEIEGLIAGYSALAVLDDLSVHIGPGEAVALLGPNGSGKTTLLRTISALLRPRAGSIRFGEVEMAAMRPDQVVYEGVAHVPQGRQVFAEQSVWDNLMLGSYLRRDRTAIRSDLDYVLEVFPALSDKLREPAGNLSGGQQQALAVARALMSNASLLLLDEPTLGLGPQVVDALGEVLNTVRKERQVGMLLVEQDAPFALDLCERAYVLSRGKVVMDRPSEELMGNRDIVYAYLSGGTEEDEGGAAEDGESDSGEQKRSS